MICWRFNETLTANRRGGGPGNSTGSTKGNREANVFIPAHACGRIALSQVSDRLLAEACPKTEILLKKTAVPKQSTDPKPILPGTEAVPSLAWINQRLASAIHMAPVDPKAIENLTDDLRPGWRKRRVRRRSAWNLLCVGIGFGLLCLYWFGLFRVMWRVHVFFYPEHLDHVRQFWRQNISHKAFASSFLIFMPLMLPSIVFGFLSANCLVWLIPPARRAMQGEAGSRKEMTFAGANAGLIRWGAMPSLICMVLSLVGALTLTSLQ